MRRVLAVAAAGLILFAGAACGDNGEDGADGTGEDGVAGDEVPGNGNGELDSARAETCVAFNSAFARLDSEEGQAVHNALFEAAESGDSDELAEAGEDYLAFTEGVAQEVREAGEAVADDPELADAMVVLADEFEAVSGEVAADPDEAQQLDMTEFQTAVRDVGVLCGQIDPAPTG